MRRRKFNLSSTRMDLATSPTKDSECSTYPITIQYNALLRKKRLTLNADSFPPQNTLSVDLPSAGTVYNTPVSRIHFQSGSDFLRNDKEAAMMTSLNTGNRTIPV